VAKPASGRIDARDDAGKLLGVLTIGEAHELLAHGHATPVGRNAMKYIRLKPGVTLGFWLGGSHTCHRVPVRDADGAKLGGLTYREHRPVL